VTDNSQREIFRRYYGLVYTIVFGRLSAYARHEDIEECVSDVFAEVFAGLDENYAFSGGLKGYIRMIASRRAVDTYRRLTAKLRFAADDISDEIADNIADTGSVSVQTEMKHIILNRIEELGKPDSIIIVRKFYFGFSYSEIAEDLGMSEYAVRKRAERALKKLKERLIKDGFTE